MKQWPNEKLEREMLADARACRERTNIACSVTDAGHHIPALIERVRDLEKLAVCALACLEAILESKDGVRKVAEAEARILLAHADE